jgi:hypothetical protein
MSSPAEGDGSIGPIYFDSVLQKEEEYIRKCPYEAAALCISGGGIRSATFALGVLQGLAEKGILTCFDYLSTVSGGGYIGGWLSAWIHRANGSCASIVDKLKPETFPEPEEITNLRRFSNYLTPKLGLLSGDTWALVSIVVRNLLLNWLVLIPVLFAALLLPRLFVSMIAQTGFELEQGLRWAAGAVLVAVVFIALALLTERWCDSWQRVLFFLTAFLLLVAAVLTSLELWSQRRASVWTKDLRSLGAWLPWVCLAALVLFFLYLCFWRRSKWLSVTLRCLNAFLLGGTLLAIEVWLLLRYVIPLLTEARLFTCLVAPLFVVALVLSGYLFTGLTHTYMKEVHREWLSSLGGWLLMFALLWGVSSALTLFGPALFYPALYPKFGWGSWGPWIATYGSAVGAAIAAVVTAVRGYGERTPAGRRETGALPGPVKIGLAAFIVLLAPLLSYLANPVLVSLGAVSPGHQDTHSDVVTNTLLGPLLLVIVGLVGSSIVLSRWISVNQFSLHAMYRNRLIRAYLGASHPGRKPNPVCGFAPDDDLSMRALRDQKPLHVINMTLNLAGGDELAWQERKAESFSATPYHTGTEQLGYRDSKSYGGVTVRPITLGTAMAISGAAASPNMGYNSSPLLTFVMTLFNARLGWWLGNPGPAGEKSRWLNSSWDRSGPAFGLWYLLKEAFSLTDDKTRYVNLSDGGHFDNLGLYEMIRRKCKHIMVIDGGCDPNFRLDDLGNAVRKCRIDFGATIKFDSSLKDLVGRKRRWAVADIDYDAVHKGHLIYLKPLMLKPRSSDEPLDVRAYHAQHDSFPHEPTADQFFSESQFESYRQLGLHSVAKFPPMTSSDCYQMFDQLIKAARRGDGPRSSEPSGESAHA